MEWYQIVANVLGAIGMILIFVTSAFKNKKLVLSVQAGGHLFLAASDAFAGSWSAFSQELLCLLRDILIVTKKANKVVKIIIIAAIAGIGYGISIATKANIFSYLAVTGNVLFTIDIFYNNKSIVGFKIISAVNNVLWMMLFIDIKVYTSAIANGASFFINVGVAIWLFVNIKKGEFDRMGNKINTEEVKEENKEETIEEQ